jgi:branched-chain amino acid transport system permease protein
MDLFLQLVAQGFATGALYAILGLSFGLIFNTTGVFHFAHGAVFTIGAYAIYLLVSKLGVPFVLAMLLAAALCACCGMACELFLYRPLRRRGAPPLLMFLASFALLIVLQNALLIAFGGVSVSLASGATGMLTTSSLRLSTIMAWKMGAGLAVAVIVFLLLQRTSLGKQLRAIVSHREMARVAGIDLGRSYLYAYALGSALTVPASAIALYDQGVTPDLGEAPLLIATVAVFAGGIGAFMGGALGGLALGLLASLSVFWFSASFQLTVALTGMTLFLLWRPAGLLGLKLRRV